MKVKGKQVGGTLYKNTLVLSIYVLYNLQNYVLHTKSTAPFVFMFVQWHFQFCFKCLPIPESHNNIRIIIVLLINPLDYSHIVSCFISLFCRVSNQLWLVACGNLIEYSIWYMNAENNCAEVVLNKQRCLLRGYFFQIKGVMEKLGVTDFFSVKNIGVSIWNKQEVIGWLQYFIEICVQWQPHANYQRYAQWGLHYWFMISW